MFSEEKEFRAELKKDIYQAKRPKGDGGDFYVPFWAAAKVFLAKNPSLDQVAFKANVEGLVHKSKQRERLYPELEKGFLKWLDNKPLWTNQNYNFTTKDVKSKIVFKELDATVKVENILCVDVEDGSKRIIYPYFSEVPALPDEGAKLGFWALAEALPGHPLENFRILDIIRSRYFRPSEFPLNGDEKAIFEARFREILKRWRELGGG